MANLDTENTELESQEETNTEEETTEQNSDSDSETSNNKDDENEISYEQAIERKRKAERLDKAEKALVEKKRAEKEAKKQQSSNPSSKEELKQLLAEERFYEKNPEADLYRSEIEKYQKKGLSLNESYILATQKDKEVENNRNIYGKSIVKGEQSSGESVKPISLDIYDKMSESEQNKYNIEMTKKFGGVRFK